MHDCGGRRGRRERCRHAPGRGSHLNCFLTNIFCRQKLEISHIMCPWVQGAPGRHWPLASAHWMFKIRLKPPVISLCSPKSILLHVYSIRTCWVHSVRSSLCGLTLGSHCLEPIAPPRSPSEHPSLLRTGPYHGGAPSDAPR